MPWGIPRQIARGLTSQLRRPLTARWSAPRPLLHRPGLRFSTASSNGASGPPDNTPDAESVAASRAEGRHLPEGWGTVSVDRKGLFKSSYDQIKPGVKEPTNLFIEEIKMHLGVRGPFSVVDWMRLCLGHPQFGYYQTAEPFGQEGDFVTSPEISPIFGELLAVWCVRTWQKMGSPKTFRLMECGPGNGTLMKHVIRVAKRFPEFRQALRSIHLVENSPRLREKQRKSLNVTLDAKGSETGVAKDMWGYTDGDRVLVQWHWQIQDLPRKDPVIILANEFFDALPIHQFQYTDRGWQEKMVDLDLSDSPSHFRFVLIQTPACGTAIPPSLFPTPPPNSPKEYERGLVAMSLLQELTHIIRAVGGAALVIDYGYDHPSEDSLRAIYQHKFSPVLQNPGKQDMSANVDFAALRDAVNMMKPKEDAKKIIVHRCVTQRLLLRELGFAKRLSNMIDQISKDRSFTPEQEKQAEAICDAAIRLVDDETPRSMGLLFKALCVSDDSLTGPNTPDGFDPKLQDDKTVSAHNSEGIAAKASETTETTAQKLN